MNLKETNINDIRIIYKSEEFELYYAGLSENVKKKFEYVFNIIQTVYNLPQKFVKKLENTDFYEVRVSVGTNEYRSILIAIDHDNVIESTRILLLNGFLKKSKKDYKKEIEKATRIVKHFEL